MDLSSVLLFIKRERCCFSSTLSSKKRMSYTMYLIYKPQRRTKYHISKRKRELKITHRRRAAKTQTHTHPHVSFRRGWWWCRHTTPGLCSCVCVACVWGSVERCIQETACLSFSDSSQWDKLRAKHQTNVHPHKQYAVYIKINP